MTSLDLLLLLSLGLSAWGGWRMGLLLRVAGLVGFVGGLAVSMLTVPFAVDLVAPVGTPQRLITIGATILLTIAVISTLAGQVAHVARRSIAGTPLSLVDRGGGVLAGIAGVLVFIWFAAPLAGMIPGGLARQVRGSFIVGVVTSAAPAAPNPLAGLQTLLSDFRFPEVFADLTPAPVTQPPPEQIPVSQDVVAAAAASTVKVEAAGCGESFAGSGWTVAEDLVVTNAHVVAGATDVQVLRPDGTRADGVVVVFDDDRDLALIRVDGLGQPPLRLGTADEGEDAATLGHPGGQDELRVAPARVERTITAVGRDIYGDNRTERAVVLLGASLAQGDSGSPAIDADGTVVGTVFAISPDDPDAAYALANEELRPLLDAPRSPGATGRCT